MKVKQVFINSPPNKIGADNNPAKAGLFLGVSSESFMSDDNFIFVYGTLRKDCTTGAHKTYLTGAEFIGKAKVRGCLYRVSYYPALVLNDAAGWVCGEVYRLTSTEQLQRLDSYEDCASPVDAQQEYQRQKIALLTDAGNAFTVWVYAYQHAVDGLQLIPSGDFLNP